MRRWVGFIALVIAFLVPSSIQAQINYNFTFTDVVNGSGFGFDDPSQGAARRQTVIDAAAYIATILDGRATVNLTWNASLNNSGSGVLASFGPNGFANQPGSFQNGAVYQRIRTNTRPFTGADGSGQVNFGHPWYTGPVGGLPGSQFDLYSVALHEMTHGHAFLSLTNSNGSGLLGNTPGTADIYSAYDMFLQRGNSVGGSTLLNSNKSFNTFATFNTGLVSTLTNGNNTSTGLFYGGQYTVEVFGAPAPLYAPSTYSPGSSTSHDNTTSPAGVMNFSIGNGVARRTFQPYEIAMMLDYGFNQYNWNSTTGNWSDATLVANLANSRWTTHLGITLNAAGTVQYNTFANPAEAPILAPYGQVTSNIILNFRGSGSSGYTSTNDLGTIRLARINLNSTATATNTITGGTLLWGQNSDGTNSVIAPRIVQNNTGAFNINSNMQMPVGLTVTGTGSGQIGLGGVLSGNGGLTKQGSFTLVISNNNTYSGGTTVSAGTLLVNNPTIAQSGTGTGNVMVAGGATLGGNGSIGGLATFQSGSTLAPGNSAGTLTFNNGLNMSGGGNFRWELSSLSTSSGFDQAVVTAGTLTLGGTSSVTLDFGLLSVSDRPDAISLNPFWLSDRTWVILDWQGGGNPNQNFGSLTNGTGYTAGSFQLVQGTGSNLGDVLLVYSVVPEPTTITLCLGGVAGFFYYRRRQKIKQLLEDACESRA